MREPTPKQIYYDDGDKIIHWNNPQTHKLFLHKSQTPKMDNKSETRYYLCYYITNTL